MPPIAPHYHAPQHDVDAARAEVHKHVASFLSSAADWHRKPTEERGEPDHAGLIVSTGIGKSRLTRAALPAWIAEAKAEDRPNRVLWLVPTHKLGRETLQDMADLGLSAAAWRGREADDPDAPGTCMCPNGDAIADAREGRGRA
jgi:hypothetical protein